MRSTETDLQARLGFPFVRPSLLQQALTHRSFAADHNERLEFLGDAVLDCALSTALMQRLPDATEGDLSRIRAGLVRQSALHQLALDLGIPPLVRLGTGLERSGGRDQPAVLADTFEALIGGVHLDGGFAAAQAVVERLFEPQLRSSDLATSGRDAKTTLQELLQQHRQPPPDYALVSTAGPDHQQVFTVMCRVPAHDLAGMGSGPSRRAAEQAAAAVVHLELVEKLGLT